MFTDHAVGLDMDYPVARARFLRLTDGDWLDGLSRDAYTEGLVGEVRVGPFGRVPGMSKLVRVSLLEPVPRDDMVLVPIRSNPSRRKRRCRVCSDHAAAPSGGNRIGPYPHGVARLSRHAYGGAPPDAQARRASARGP